MDTVLTFLITNIVSFIAGAFLHKWLAAKVVAVVDPTAPKT